MLPGMDERDASPFPAFGSLTTVAARPAAAAPGRDAVRALRLANGLRVIVWPVHDIPNIALYNWVRAGSRGSSTA